MTTITPGAAGAVGEVLSTGAGAGRCMEAPGGILAAEAEAAAESFDLRVF